MPNAQILLFPFLLGIGLLAPGWLLGQALRAPSGLAGAFLGSAALLMNLILVLDALDIGLNSPHLAAGLFVICLTLAAIVKLRDKPSESPAPSFSNSWQGLKWQPYHWLLVPVVIGLSAVFLKTALDPLSGLDTKFRWNFLALQMLHEGNLHFYPAIKAEDFLHYGWCDGIAPLVSSLYLWTYLSLGKTSTWATAPVVAGQMVILFGAVYQMAGSHAKAAGYAAMAILATSCILLSGVAIGQETGLTALSLVAMFVFIERYRAGPTAGWLIWAGVAAGVGGLAREYGIIFFALGALCLANQKLPVRSWIAFLLPACLVAAPWYLRNWITTGNPLYSHELHGLFPSNPIHTQYIRTINDTIGFKANPYAIPTLTTTLAHLTGVPILLGLIGWIMRPRQLWPWLVAWILVMGLWLWSIGQTSGGYTYSLRVLTPAIAVSAVCGGLGVMRWASSSRSWLLAILLTLPAIDAAERVLYMPFNPFTEWWSKDSWAWLKIRDDALRFDKDKNWAAISEAADGKKVITTDPFVHTLLVQLGAKSVSHFSPAIRFLFEPDANYTACRARLRGMDVRFIIMPTKTAAISLKQFSQYPFFVALQNTTPAASTSLYIAYDMYDPKISP